MSLNALSPKREAQMGSAEGGTRCAMFALTARGSGHRFTSVILTVLGFVALTGCGDRPGFVDDEAKRAGKTVADFKPAAEDYFRDMDGGAALSQETIEGRNTWLVWTGGNDRFWDHLSVASV